MNKTLITVNTNSPPQGLTLTLESTSLILGIVVSFFMVIGATVKVISKFNSVENEIRDLREDLNSNTKALGEFKSLHNEVLNLDKRLELHLQAFENRGETTQFLLGQLDQKIDHNRKRWEEELSKKLP